MEQPKKGVAILTPQFTLATVLETVDRVTAPTLQAWINRKLITTMDTEQIVTGMGTPRLFNAANIIQVKIMAWLNSLGVPLDTAAKFGEMAVGRAIAKANKRPVTGEREGFFLEIWGDKEGTWQYLPNFNDGLNEQGEPDTQERPEAFITLAVDALIGIVAGKLTEIVEEREKLRRSRRFPAGVEVLEAMKPLAAKSGARSETPSPA